MDIGQIIAGSVIIFAAVVAYILYREHSRRQMLSVLINLSKSFMTATNEVNDLDDILANYHEAQQTLDQTKKYLRTENEKNTVIGVREELTNWRDKKAATYYSDRLNYLLALAKKTGNPETRIRILEQARQQIQQGSCANMQLKLVEINRSLVSLEIKKADEQAKDLPDAETLTVYEKTLWKIINDGIADKELEKMIEVKRLIQKVEQLQGKTGDQVRNYA